MPKSGPEVTTFFQDLLLASVLAPFCTSLGSIWVAFWSLLDPAYTPRPDGGSSHSLPDVCASATYGQTCQQWLVVYIEHVEQRFIVKIMQALHSKDKVDRG